MSEPVNVSSSEKAPSQRTNDSSSLNPASDDASVVRQPAPASGKRKLIIKTIKLVVLALVLLWIGRQLQKSWTEISLSEWNPHWGWLVASGFFYLCGFFPAALFWFLSLRWLGQKPDFFNSILAYYSSQLGKYVPGKAMVVVIRTGMIASNSVRASVAAASVFYETLTMMGSGAFFAAIIVFFCFREHVSYSLMALGVAGISLVPLAPPIFVKILKILKIGKGDPHVQTALQNLKYRYLALGFGLMAILWIFFGLSLWAAIQGVGVTPHPLMETLPRYIASVSLAMTLGFVVLISPGGLGIREAVLSTLLIPYFTILLSEPVNSSFTLQPEALSTIISLLQRVVSIIAEASVFALMALVGVLRKKGGEPTE